MPQGQDSFSLSPTAGSTARIYPNDNGKVVGPVAVPVNQGGVAVTIKKVVGTGTVGSYQPQESDDPDGKWFNIGSALSSEGVTNVTVHAAYVRVLMATAPQAGTSVKVSIRAGHP